MFQMQQAKIKQALQARKARMLVEAMSEDAPNVCTMVPELWPNDLSLPIDIPDARLAQEVACPECHRKFKQVGMLKRHMRQNHDIPYEIEDLYQSLRDA